MMNNLKISLIVSFFLNVTFGQIEKEVVAPYNIKTISFVQNAQNTIPIFKLGDSFQLLESFYVKKG